MHLSVMILKSYFINLILKEEKRFYRHTTSHIMAQAIEELFPGAKFGVGPPIESGFYYDIDSEKKFAEEDLVKIEQKMS